jgi:tRNA (guanosine-2'-O-)-methyltransferase
MEQCLGLMKRNASQILFDHNPPDHIIETLSPYLTDQRKARIESVISHRLDSITVAIECPADINNALAIVRTCEALGVSTIHIISAEHDARYINIITKSAFYWVTIFSHATLDDFITAMKNESRKIAGAIMSAEKNISEVKIDQSICLLLGNEHRGLSKEAKNACDFFYSIPMCGMTDSLNLSVAAAISLFDVTQRKRAQLKNHSDLSENSAQKLRAKFYLNSVSARLAIQLIRHPFIQHVN